MYDYVGMLQELIEMECQDDDLNSEAHSSLNWNGDNVPFLMRRQA
jgi:hypothetical protein